MIRTPDQNRSRGHRPAGATRAPHTSPPAREEPSMIENPPMTAFVSGTGPSEIVPSVPTMLDCWRWTPPPKIQTPAALASRTTACDDSPTAGQSSSGMWSIEPSSNEIRYRGMALLHLSDGYDWPPLGSF